MVKSSVPTHKYFWREGVNVKYAGHTHYEAQRIEKFPSREDMPVRKGGFKPGRLVINLKLVDLNDPKHTMLRFDPPIELRIRFDKTDLDNAHLSIADRNKLTLGYWDGEQWITFTDKIHQFQVIKWDAIKERGLAVMNIYEWGDPPIAVGT